MAKCFIPSSYLFSLYTSIAWQIIAKKFTLKNKLSAIMFSEFPLQIEEAPSANFDQGCFLTHVLTTVKRNEKRLAID